MWGTADARKPLDFEVDDQQVNTYGPPQNKVLLDPCQKLFCSGSSRRKIVHSLDSKTFLCLSNLKSAGNKFFKIEWVGPLHRYSRTQNFHRAFSLPLLHCNAISLVSRCDWCARVCSSPLCTPLTACGAKEKSKGPIRRP